MAAESQCFDSGPKSVGPTGAKILNFLFKTVSDYRKQYFSLHIFFDSQLSTFKFQLSIVHGFKW